MEIVEAGRRVNKDVLVIAHGGPFDEPDNIGAALSMMPGVNGLEASPELKRQPALRVVSFPYAWPDSAELEGAATLVFYFDGNRRHPLFDEKRLAQVARLMANGVGLVALHQAFTVPIGEQSIDLPGWLGGARYGLHDRTWETVHLAATAGHPVTRGVEEIVLHDEFYPTIRFAADRGRLTPILTGEMRPQFESGVPVYRESASYAAAWAFERAQGGGSFAYSGLHFLKVLDNPGLRKVLLNAIFWTAGLEVPEEGVSTQADPHAASKLARPGQGRARVTTSVVTRSTQHKIVPMPWGRIEWHVSGGMGNSDTMTTGIARIAPGHSNPRHFHPNCDEVLHVLQGRIRHTMNDRTVEMSAGDVVSIPQGVYHNATNIGDEEAVLAISFSSGATRPGTPTQSSSA